MTNQYCDRTGSNGTLNVICQNCKIRTQCILKIILEHNAPIFEKLIKNKIPLKKGNRLFPQGQPFKALYMVFSGSLRSYTSSLSGKEQITGIYWPGDLIGLDGIFRQQYSQSVKALENSSVIELPYSKMHSLFSENPAIQNKLFVLMNQAMNQSQEIAAILRTKSAEARYAAYLLGISERFRQLGHHADIFTMSLSRTDIANYLQMATETISRVSTQFQRDQWIEVQKNRVTLLQRAPLQRLAAQVMPKYAAPEANDLSVQENNKTKILASL